MKNVLFVIIIFLILPLLIVGSVVYGSLDHDLFIVDCSDSGSE